MGQWPGLLKVKARLVIYLILYCFLSINPNSFVCALLSPCMYSTPMFRLDFFSITICKYSKDSVTAFLFSNYPVVFFFTYKPLSILKHWSLRKKCRLSALLNV